MKENGIRLATEAERMTSLEIMLTKTECLYVATKHDALKSPLYAVNTGKAAIVTGYKLH